MYNDRWTRSSGRLASRPVTRRRRRNTSALWKPARRRTRQRTQSGALVVLVLSALGGLLWLALPALRRVALAWLAGSLHVVWWIVGGSALLALFLAGGGWWLARWLVALVRHRARRRAARLRALQDMDPLAFERQVGQLFTLVGYQVSYTPRSGDEGIDLWVEGPPRAGWPGRLVGLRRLSGGGRVGRLPVQCKRYEAGHAVGSPELQRFSGALRRVQAQRGIFVTTSRFTPAAVAWARKEGIHLIDGQALARAQQWRFPEDAPGLVAPSAVSAEKGGSR